MFQLKQKQPERILKVAISEWNNMNHKCLEPNSLCQPGFELEILSLVAIILNFKLQFKLSNEPGCGIKLQNGTWTGVLGMVDSDEADMTGNICKVTEKRMSDFNVSWPVVEDSGFFLIKAPEPAFSFTIGGPFQTIVWILLLIIFLLFTFTFAIYLYFYSLPFSKAILISLEQAIGFVAGMNGINRFHWILYENTMAFMALIYSTFIMTALLKPICINKPFSNLEEMTNELYNGNFRLISYYNPPRACYGGSCKKFHKAISHHGFVLFPPLVTESDISQVLDHIVKNDNTVFALSERTAKLALHLYRQRSKIWLIKDKTATSEFYSFFFGRNFQFGRLFDKALIFLDSAKDNLKSHYNARWKQAEHRNHVKGRIKADFVWIDMKLILGPLKWCMAGFLISLIVFCLEIIFKFARH